MKQYATHCWQSLTTLQQERTTPFSTDYAAHKMKYLYAVIQYIIYSTSMIIISTSANILNFNFQHLIYFPSSKFP